MSELETLFNIRKLEITKRKEKCKQCRHSQRWEISDKYFWYCKARKSKRTSNGLLKIKANQEACDNFKEI